MTYTEAERRLTNDLNKESVITDFIGHMAISVLVHVIPHIGTVLFVYQLFAAAGYKAVSYFMRAFAFQELMCHMFPAAMALASSANAQLQFGLGLSNISQIQLSHFMILCLLYYLFVWGVGAVVLFVNPRDALYVVLNAQSDYTDPIYRYTMVKLMSEPLLYSMAYCPLFFVLGERNDALALVYSVLLGTLRIVLVYTIFIVNRAYSGPGTTIYHLAMLEFGVGLFFALLVVLYLYFRGGDRLRNIYFYVSRRYLFPINWVTMYRIFMVSLPGFAFNSVGYVTALVSSALCVFNSTNRREQTACHTLFALLWLQLSYQALTGAANAFMTYHAYYVGKQQLQRARKAVNVYFIVAVLTSVAIICVLVVTRFKVYVLFVDSAYTDTQNVLGQYDSLNGNLYICFLMQIITTAVNYILVSHYFWILGLFTCGMSYLHLAINMLDKDFLNPSTASITVIVMRQGINLGCCAAVTLLFLYIVVGIRIQKQKWN